jgi:pyrimidine and pyridine-specific 5'-nucleotidase
MNKAMQQAGVTDPSKCYFVDDSIRNVVAADAQGWGHCVHFYEKGLEVTEGGRKMRLDGTVGSGGQDGNLDIAEISDLQQLREVWPEIFRST